MRASGSTTGFERSPCAKALEVAQYYSEPRLDAGRAVPSHCEGEPLFEKLTGSPGGALANFSFGPFRLVPTQFLLLEGDKPVPLGSRALEILIVLVERPGQVVTKQELMARVWPDVFVEPCNLTVHISALRRALRDGQAGNRFVINIPGRGYSFVSPVEVLGRAIPARATDRSAEARPLLTCVE